MNADDRVRSSFSTSVARYVRKGAAGPPPFVPFGLIPLLGLVLVLALGLFLFARAGVESAAERAAQQALKDVGADWARARVSGQWVVIEGAPPTLAAANAAEEAVRNAKAGTWLFAASPVTRVTVRYDFSEPAERTGGGAGGVTGGEPAGRPAQWTAPTEADACNNRMSELLDTARIEFDTGSTAITTTSGSLLDSIVRAARDCPGVLRITGYTDNIGSDEINRDLSLSRAEAVRSALVRRGVPAARLVAEGRGADDPASSNNTEAGRSRNRRIEIRVIDPPN